jgi:hypothetical protein
MSDPQGALGLVMSKLKEQGGGGEQKPPEEKYADMSDKVVWEPAKAAEDYDIRLAEGSIRPMSESALRAQVIELKKVGLIDSRHALQLLDIPDADEIADELQKELELAALAKVGRK